MSIWSKLWKGVLFVGGLVGVYAQAKSAGMSEAAAIAATATALGPAAAALQVTPIGKKPEAK